MNKSLLIGFGVFIAVVIAGALFLPKSKEKVVEVNSSPQASSSEAPSSIDSSIGSQESVKEITIAGDEFSFDPSTIQLKVGEKVKLTFRNKGNTIHDFAIEEFDVVTKKIFPGETDTVEFTPQKAGTFAYICGVGDHEHQGMKGVLTVSP